MPLLSATDCIQPAFRHTTQQMFTRFRFAFWLRMAVLAFFTAEMTGGGGVGGSFPTSFPSKPSGGRGGAPNPIPWHMGWFTPVHILELALVIAVVVVVITLILVYIHSILRFVLFEAVLHGDTRLREGWHKWNDAGHRYFTWLVMLTVVSWVWLVLCVGVPGVLLFRTHHIGIWHIDAMAIAVMVVAGLVWLAVSMAILIAMVLAKDFVVPIMALEGVSWQEGWRRFLAIAHGRASEYVVYFLMKIVLRIGAGIVQGIVSMIVMFVLLVPVVFVAIAGVAVGVGASLMTKAILITIAIVGLLLLMAIFVVITALVGAPVGFFFVAYSIYFFAGRYGELGKIVFPEPPASVIPEPLPEPPPMPA